MFFIASKLVGIVLQPINFLALLSLSGLAFCLTRFARLGRALAVTAAFLFAIVCFLPVSSLLLRPLEDRFSQPDIHLSPPTGIIVLGGSIDADVGAARGQPTLTEAAARLTTGVALSRRFPSARLVFTGGSSDVRQNGLDEAQDVRRLWISLGVPEDRMTFEDDSRNTFENATLTRALVNPKDGDIWLLVTSAAHMPRSVGIFRKDGWRIVPYPVDYRTFGDARDFRFGTNGLDSFQRLTVALHEWMGLLAYWLSGKTNSLFPGP